MAAKARFVKKIDYPDEVLGRTCYYLINISTGLEIAEYREYLTGRIIEGMSPKSIEGWSDDLLNFYRYYCAATEFIASSKYQATATVLSDIIYSYPKFLAEATDSKSLIAREAAKLCGANAVSKATAGRRISTLRTYLANSAATQQARKDMAASGLIDIDVDSKVLFQELNQRSEATSFQRNALIQNSFLAGVVRGGPRYVASTMFMLPKMTSKCATGEGAYAQKSFPFASVMDVLDAATTHRDRAFWALLFGTGIRTHEATHLTIDDVNGRDREVLILPYDERVAYYGDKTIKEGDQKKSKGRASETTEWLEPFKEIFFQSIKLYLEHEKPSCSHDMLFVSLSNNARGRPMYLGDATAHNKPFKIAQKKLGFDKVYGLHSARHFFGTWTHNFVPTDTGFGLELATVQRMMGHAKSSTTAKYAIKDREVVRAQMEAVNLHMRKMGFDFAAIKRAAINHPKIQAGLPQHVS